MSTRIVRGAGLAGCAAVVVLGLAAPSAQEKPAPGPQYPLAAYEEVKPFGPGKPGAFEWEPAGVDVDKKGNVVFLRRSSPAVWVLDTNGKVIRSFGNDLFVWAHGMHVDPQGNIWATGPAPVRSRSSSCPTPRSRRPVRGTWSTSSAPRARFS